MLLLTVSDAVPFTVPDVAVMVLVPTATAVASPVLLMVAMLGAEEVQVTCELTLPVVLLPKVAVAVNCCVAFGRIMALAGDSEIDTIVSAEGKNPPQLLSSKAARTPALSLPSHLSHCTSAYPTIPRVPGRLTSVNPTPAGKTSSW